MLGTSYLGTYFPVIRPERPDSRVATQYTDDQSLLALDNQRLAEVDPVAMNLLVARGMPEVEALDITRYQRIVNEWADDFRDRCLPEWELHFHQTPEHFGNDLTSFRLGMLTRYLEECCQIRYKPELKEARPGRGFHYTDPADLFLHGVIDSREGTCGNLAALHQAIGWRLGWPVSLARADSHIVMRWDDGASIYNVEATAVGEGGFFVVGDEHYIERHHLPRKALTSESDLTALTPRQMLGLFIGLRARIYENTDRFPQAEVDYLQARVLYPASRNLCFAQLQVGLQQAAVHFDVGERGHPNELAGWLNYLCQLKGWPVVQQPITLTNGATKPANPRSRSQSKRSATLSDIAISQIDVGL